MYSTTQDKCLALFQQKKFQELILEFRDSPLKFPSKQYPVGGFRNHGTPGQFGFRVSNTTFAFFEEGQDRYITFTIGVLGELTLNLHAPTPDAIDWVNGTQDTMWVHKHQIDKRLADELAIWAESVEKSVGSVV